MTDQEEILLERIRDKEHTEIYTRMLKLCEDDIERLKKEIAAITDYSATIKKTQSGDERERRFNRANYSGGSHQRR